MNRKALEEKRNDLKEEMKSLLDNAKAEKRALTSKEIKNFDKLEKEIKDIDTQLEKEERKREMDNTKTKMNEIEKRESKDFENYLRNRASNLTTGENGAVIPTTIVNKIIKKVYDICPVLEKSTKYNVKGKIQVPYYDDTDNGIIVAFSDEFTELAGNVGKFKSIELSGYLAGALTLVSNSLINNSQFNIVDFVINEMAESIARFIEDTLLNGKGSVEGLTGIKNVVTSASATAITGDEIIKLKDSIKDNFQNKAFFIMSNATRTALRLLKDSNERYLLNDDVSSPFGTTLLGKPVYVSDNMADMGAGKDAIIYGDMSCLATKFSENAQIQVLKEKYATQHATGVVGWIEFDSKVENTQGIAKLTMKNA